MSLDVFVSAVSDEFHKKDPRRPRSFESYRDVLARSLRILVRDCRVMTQEDLAQGMGELLATLETEIRRSHLVVHLIGEMAGSVPQPAAVRHLRHRNSEWLTHVPELAAQIGEGEGISYTQWEAYLGFQHRRGMLVFQVESDAPRSPKRRVDEDQVASQQRHVQRLKVTGKHYQQCHDQADLARKVVASVEQFGLVPSTAPRPSAEKIAAAMNNAGAIAAEIGAALRASARRAVSEIDPAGIEAFLGAIDTASLQRELDRRTALQAVSNHQAKLQETVADDPTPENLNDLAFAELALGHYHEAMLVSERLANEQLALMESQPEEAEQRREMAMNALLLLGEAAQLAGRREDAIAALERTGGLVDMEKEPILWADVHESLAEYLLDHALWDRAEPLIDQIVDIREDFQGEGDPALPKSLVLWCRLLSVRARYEGIVGVAARAARLFGGQSPINPDGLAAAYSSEGIALRELGRFREAEERLRLAVGLAEHTRGANYYNIAATLNNLADVLRTTNRLSEAELLCRRALSIMEQGYGPDHPKVATPLNNLAQLLYETNQITEAEPLCRRALEINERTYGPDHPAVALCLSNVINLLWSTNRLSEAEPLCRRALAINERAYGSDHPRTAMLLNNLAVLLESTNRLSEAEPLCRRALAIDEHAYGSDHPTVATHLNNLTALLLSMNRPSEAEPLCRRALAIDERSYGPDHPTVALRLANLAALLQRMNRLSEAEPLYRRALDIYHQFSQTAGYQHPEMQTTMKNYASFLIAKKSFPEGNSAPSA